MTAIQYDHSSNIHTLEGPRSVLPLILQLTQARSILDVGCGVATWLKVARELGVSDVFGIDGIDVKPADLLIPKVQFKVQDLTQPIELGRKYDLALCLEVGEHLDSKSAAILVQTLTHHADTIVFSAACPDQEGQHHVNGQWPTYWQKLFNARGFACFDELRLQIWDEDLIEPWYRQNLFVARRVEAGQAGTEPRIRPMIHPGIIQGIINTNNSRFKSLAETGAMPFLWYLKLPFSITAGWVKRLLR